MSGSPDLPDQRVGPGARSFPPAAGSAWFTGMSQEMALLVWCGCLSPGRQRTRKMRQLAADVPDWELFLLLARRHGMLGLAHHHLQDCCADLIPPGVTGLLREAAVEISGRNLMMAREMGELVSTLEREGIPVIALKGPTLALDAYGNLALRPFVDLDLLIHPEHLERALETLRPRGYLPSVPTPPGSVETLCALGYDLALRRNDGLPLELHWQLEHRYLGPGLKTAEVFARRRFVAGLGHQAPALALEDLLLSLASHGAKHLWDRLEWVCAFAHVVSRNTALDWPALIARANRLGFRRKLDLALYLARDLPGFDSGLLPEELRTSPREAARLGRVVQKRLAQGAVEAPTLGEWLRFIIRTPERPADQLALALRLLFAPTVEDWIVVRLPLSLAWLYYVVRPFRLAFRYLPVRLRRRG